MNLREGKFKNANGGTQLFLLLALWYFGIILGASLSHLLLGDNVLTTASNIRISHLINGVCVFLVPSTVYALMFTDWKGEFLVKSPISIAILLLAVLAIFCIQPLVETINHYNNLIALPESLSTLQDFFEQTKVAGEKTLKLVFADKSFASLAVNIVVIAILPGIVEELFFRGCMQRSIMKMGNNKHIAIWVTAIIFSLLHFQLAGFFPRIILGALLGYLYVWSKNIWVPIIVHILHNATIVIVAQMLLETEFYKSIAIADYSLNNAGVAAFISLIITSAILFTIHKYRVKEKGNI